MNTFLNEWLAGLEMKTSDEFKDLIVVDQIRKKSHDLREHFCDELPIFTKVGDLMNKLYDYKAAPNNLRKREIKYRNSNFRKRPTQGTESNKVFHRNDVSRVLYDKNYIIAQKNNFNGTRIRCFNCSDPSHKSINWPRKKEGPICFRCKNFGHKSDSCTL